MGKKNSNKNKKKGFEKNILNESKNEKELKKIKHKLEELKKDYDKKIKRLNQEKDDKTRILNEKYAKFVFTANKGNELEAMNKKTKKSKNNKDIFISSNDKNKDIKFTIPKYKLPEVGVLYEYKDEFYLAIQDYDELEKANEIAKGRYNNAKVVVE